VFLWLERIIKRASAPLLGNMREQDPHWSELAKTRRTDNGAAGKLLKQQRRILYAAARSNLVNIAHLKTTH
jgi:hypothetical protein